MSESELSQDPIFKELSRIFPQLPTAAEGSKQFTLLPLVSEEDALQFLRTVPAGVSMEELSRLALAYRQANPNPVADAPDEDLESAG